MLEPRDRRLLFDLFRPPDGFQLDAAIGTTYSLDLLTLLVTPLAFTLFDWEAKDGRIKASPIALLESLRRYADRITVFHQAEGLQAPPRHRLLFGYLEQSLVPVTPRTLMGVFHPKVWVLRFAPREGERRSSTKACYRLICSSRNLTFDRSWDAVLTLEGEYVPRSRRLPENRPLQNFLRELPKLATRGVAPEVEQRVATIAEEIGRVPFEGPVGFDELRFWSLGLGDKTPPFLEEPVDRMLVISPFLSDSLIANLAGQAGSATLVSRTEELDKLAEQTLHGLDAIFALDPGAEIEPESTGDSQEPVDLGESTDTLAQPNDQSLTTAQSAELSGLHAKLIVTESGRRSRVWMGSANATDAAYSSNVEFLVELEGPVGKCGIDELLDPDRQSGFAVLLQEYVRTGQPPPEPQEEQLKRQFDLVQRSIALLPLHAEVTALPDPELFDLRLVSERLDDRYMPSEVTIRCRPLSLADAWYQEFRGGEIEIAFSRLPFESLTSFFVFELSGVIQTGEVDQRLTRLFLLNVPLVGAPKDRKERMLLSLLRNKQQILRYLLLLLSDEGWEPRKPIPPVDDPPPGGTANTSDPYDVPLLESLVLSLARHPEKLDQIQRLITDLKKTPEGTAIIPDGLLEVWEPIWSVREERQDVSTQ